MNLGLKLYRCITDYKVSYKANENFIKQTNKNEIEELERDIQNKSEAEKIGPYGNDDINKLLVETSKIILEVYDEEISELMNTTINDNIKVKDILNWITWNGCWNFFNEWYIEYNLHNDVISIEKIINLINERLYELEPNYLLFYNTIKKWNYKRNKSEIILNIDDKVLNKEIQVLLMTYHLIYICFQKDIRYIMF